MKYLALWLEGPLQSWGCDSKFDVRSTCGFPTKSGVFGLLLAASGDSGPQDVLLGRMQDVSMTAYVYRRDDSPGLLRDFHMIGNGYNLSDQWQDLHTTRTKDGKRPVGGGAKLTYRYYLQDGAFGVVLGLEDELAAKFDKALTAPVFDLYLGRKCCVPSDLIGRGYVDEMDGAVQQLDQLARTKGFQRKQTVSETAQMDVETMVIDDVPLRFGVHKVYKERLVHIGPAEPLEEGPTGKQGDGEQADH